MSGVPTWLRDGRGVIALIGVVVLALGFVVPRLRGTPEAMSIAPSARPDAAPPEAVAVPELPEVPTLPPGTTLSRDHGAGATEEEEVADLGAEMRLLADARRALRGDEPAVALSLLEQHRERFPHGGLAETREAYTIVALRAQGHTEDAERRLTDFRVEYPGSHMLDTVLDD